MTQLIDKATIVATLEKVRETVAGGWHEPFSLDAEGRLCTVDDEGITRVCVVDSVKMAAGQNIDLRLATFEVLEARFRDVGGMARWLEAPGRQLPDVLRFLERATAHLRAET